MPKKEYKIQMEVAGKTAMFTRPDSGDTPCSYPVPTYSAVRGMFESVIWGQAILIIPRKVEICSPLQYHSYVTNYNGPLRSSKSIKNGNAYQMVATVLVDVCYRLYADVIPNSNKNDLPEKALSWDKRTTSPGHAYQEIFNRRLKRGQSYSTMCLGWSEFTAEYFGPFRESTEVCTSLPEIYIPSMLREVFSDGCRSDYRPVYDNDIYIRNGVLEFPRRNEGI